MVLNSDINRDNKNLNERLSLSRAGLLKPSALYKAAGQPKIVTLWVRITEKIAFYEIDLLRKIFYTINLTSEKVTQDFQNLPPEAFQNKLFVAGLKFIRYQKGRNIQVDQKAIYDYLKRVDRCISYLNKIKPSDDKKQIKTDINSYIKFKSLPTSLDVRVSVGSNKKYMDEYIKFFNQDPSKLLKQRLEILKKIVKANEKSENEPLLEAIKIVTNSLTKDFPKLIKYYNYNGTLVQRLSNEVAYDNRKRMKRENRKK